MGNPAHTVILGPFVPPDTEKAPIDFERLTVLTGKQFQYASRGRHAIFHALKALNVEKGVIIPAYACPTIKDAVDVAGLTCYFCDIQVSDLNICFDSFVQVHKETGADCVIVPSLYGNPADLQRFWDYCKDNGVKMIDDSAQSFGATLNGKYLSSFGDAGLVAFSPGKSTPSAMGALFWYDGDYSFSRTTHDFLHKLIYRSYFVNRKNYYSADLPKLIKKVLGVATIYMERLIPIRNDQMACFEDGYLGGMISACLDGDLSYRNSYSEAFRSTFAQKDWFDIISCQQGTPMNHKLVVLLQSKETADALRNHLLSKGIHTFGGYRLPENCFNCPISESVVGRVVEMPIEIDSEKMDYLFTTINNYFIDKERK